MKWIGTGLSDMGRVRNSNQDAYAVDNEHQLWIVADGMGGHVGGDIASRLAVDSVLQTVKLRAEDWDRVETSHEGEHVLVEAVETANHSIRAYAMEHPTYYGMGTTIVVLKMFAHLPGMAIVAHAGDSRAYRIRDHELAILTRDHSMVQEQIDLGLLRPEEAEHHPLRHILTKALGIEPRVQPAVQTFTVQPTDRFLLCTDGLTKMLDDLDIAKIIETTCAKGEALCQALISEANARGGEDNITVVLIEPQDHDGLIEASIAEGRAGSKPGVQNSPPHP